MGATRVATDHEIGTVVRDGDNVHIWTDRGWAWFPTGPGALIAWARSYGWGARVDIPADGVLRMNADCDLVLPVLLGREADGDDLAYLFRVTWVCEARGGQFKLAGHIYKTNRHGWTDIPSINAVKRIISRHPVVKVPEPRKG